MEGAGRLLDLAMDKLNITWEDRGTERRIAAILEDAVPSVADMVGLSYSDGDAEEADGTVFDFSEPSIERNLLMNYVAYEWNHQADVFRETYKEDILACRRRRVVAEGEEDDSEESSE